jgi:hypothetical protein
VCERHVRRREGAERGAVFRVHELGGHVVDAQREEARAEPGEGAQLLDQRRHVCGVRVADREPGRDCEADFDAGVASAPHQLAEARPVVGRVGLAPALALERIVLRRHQIRVHAEPRELLHPPEPVGVCPRAPVEAFDDAAMAKRRVQ